MDDEVAEIELLEQNLNRTRAISKKMTSLLSKLDTRLIALENSMMPLRTATQTLNRRNQNVDAVLQRIEHVATSQEDVAEEEGLVLRGPRKEDLSSYMRALERLNAKIAFKSSDGSSRESARIVETGVKRLTQLYTTLVAEASSGAARPVDAYSPDPFPQSTLSILAPLVAFLRKMPVPATHPSHPAAPVIAATLKEAQGGYADMRGNWARKCVEQAGRRAVERAESASIGGNGVTAGRDFGQWVVTLLDQAEVEYGLLQDLALQSSPPQIASAFERILSPLMSLFSEQIAALSSVIKRSLQQHTFLALSTYSALTSVQSTRENVAGSALREGMHSLRAICLRCFPELLQEVRSAATSGGDNLPTRVMEVTLSTLDFLEQLPLVEDAATSALVTLGDGNWKMGEANIGKTVKSTVDDAHVVVEHYLHDVVSTLVSSLTTLSRGQKRPAIGSIFLLNNVCYVTFRLSSSSSDINSLLAKPTKDFLTSNFRTAKATYFDSNFSPLMACLTEERDKSGKSAMKEKWARFFDILDELSDRHRADRVLAETPESRAELEDEVTKLVVPAMQRMMERNKAKEKYIRMSPEEVESKIRSFYR